MEEKPEPPKPDANDFANAAFMIVAVCGPFLGLVMLAKFADESLRTVLLLAIGGLALYIAAVCLRR